MNRRTCTTCHITKIQELDFYYCNGRYRGDCKQCTIRKNAKYQRDNKTWLSKNIDKDRLREYMKEYRQKNPEKFREYRQRFIDKHPGYFRNYYLEHKGEK